MPTSPPSWKRSRSKTWPLTASAVSIERGSPPTPLTIAAVPPAQMTEYLVPEWVRVRRESFGLLFYDTRSTKLTFVRSGGSLTPPPFTGERRVLPGVEPPLPKGGLWQRPCRESCRT